MRAKLRSGVRRGRGNDPWTPWSLELEGRPAPVRGCATVRQHGPATSGKPAAAPLLTANSPNSSANIIIRIRIREQCHAHAAHVYKCIGQVHRTHRATTQLAHSHRAYTSLTLISALPPHAVGDSANLWSFGWPRRASDMLLAVTRPGQLLLLESSEGSRMSAERGARSNSRGRRKAGRQRAEQACGLRVQWQGCAHRSCTLARRLVPQEVLLVAWLVHDEDAAAHLRMVRRQTAGEPRFGRKDGERRGCPSSARFFLLPVPHQVITVYARC